MSENEETKKQTDLEKKRESKALTEQQKMQTLADLIRSDESKVKILEGAPKYFNEDALIRVAISAIQKNPKLLNCTQASLMRALMECAYYGLYPESTTNEAHLVPYGDQCVLITGYAGLVKMATNSGLVSHIEVSKVFENDYFEYELGLNKRLEHIPVGQGTKGKHWWSRKKSINLDKNRGEYLGTYAVVVFTNGRKDFRYVTKEEGMAHGERYSKSFKYKESVWKMDPEAMITKTSVRFALKFVPKSPQSERLLIAIARDEKMETRGPLIDLPVEPQEEIPTPQPLKKEQQENEKGRGEPEVPHNVDPETGEEIPEDLPRG